MKYLTLLLFFFLVACNAPENKVTPVIFVSAQNECIANDGLKYILVLEVYSAPEPLKHDSYVKVECNNNMSTTIVVKESNL